MATARIAVQAQRRLCHDRGQWRRRRTLHSQAAVVLLEEVARRKCLQLQVLQTGRALLMRRRQQWILRIMQVLVQVLGNLSSTAALTGWPMVKNIFCGGAGPPEPRICAGAEAGGVAMLAACPRLTAAGELGTQA